MVWPLLTILASFHIHLHPLSVLLTPICSLSLPYVSFKIHLFLNYTSKHGKYYTIYYFCALKIKDFLHRKARMQPTLGSQIECSYSQVKRRALDRISFCMFKYCNWLYYLYWYFFIIIISIAILCTDSWWMLHMNGLNNYVFVDMMKFSARNAYLTFLEWAQYVDCWGKEAGMATLPGWEKSEQSMVGMRDVLDHAFYPP